MVTNYKIALITPLLGIVLRFQKIMHLHYILVHKIQIYANYLLQIIFIRYLIILHECLEFS